jgi:iron complex outermembrane recepter protein
MPSKSGGVWAHRGLLMTKHRSSRAVAIATAAHLMLLCTLGISARAQTASQNPAPAPDQTSAPGTAPTGTAPTSSGELQTVTVTGYLIPRVGEGPQPVATLNQDFIQKQAYQTVNDVLNNYPGGISQQNAMTFAGNSNSPASSAFGLKGLPANFTLVLIDGYRFPAYPIPINSTETFVDINSIPLAAIDRIEILKDGGSATYGEDAVAGVVNLVLKDDYNGADIINYIGESQRGDFEVYHLSMTGGASEKGAFGKVSVVATFDYYDQSPIDSIDRWYAYGGRANYATNYPNQPVQFFPPNGSYFVAPSAAATAPFSGVVVKPGTTGVGGITANDFLINGTPSEEYIPNNEQLAARERRYGGTINMTYYPWDWLKLYDHFIIQRNEETSVTPSQGFSAGDLYPANQAIYGTTSLVIPANNPYNPFHVPLVPNGQAEYEFGPWYSDVIGRTFRNIAGGTLFLPWNNWFVDANAIYGESDVSQYVYNAIKTRQLQEALNGQLPQLPGVFFNPFTDGSTGAQPNSVFFPYLRTVQSEDNRSDLIQYTLKAGGTIWALPSGDLTAAGGLEYRSESLIFSNDPNSRNDNITSGDFEGHLFSGYRWIQSAYGELDVPLLGDQWSWPGLRSLQVTLSERYDDYSHFGSAAKPKFAVLYKPFDDLTFRATYSENYVVPTLGELFSTPLQFQTTIFDPIKNESYNVLLQNGGNPNLKPQSAYGYYLEVVWTPASKDENSWWHWLKGLTAYFDWYQTEVHGLIATPNPQTVVAAGLPGAVIRNSAGFIDEVFANYQNLGNLLTDGIEFGVSYDTKEYNWGKLQFDWNGAYIYNMALTQLETEPNGFAKFILTDLTDLIGSVNGVPQGSGPDFKFVGSLFYSKHVFGNDLFRTGITVNFISSELDQTNDAHGTIPAVDAPLSPPGYVHLIGSWTTWDWQISYEFGPPVEVTPETPKPGYDKEGKRLVGEKAVAPPAEGHGWTWRRLLDNTTFTFGIKNIFDTRPPLQVATGGPFFQGYDTQIASPVQRFFYGQIEKKF